MTGYILCATPRSGSTLLCRMLEQIGAGRPHSFFRAEDLDDWATDWGVPTPVRTVGSDYLRAAKAAGTSATGVFGLRMMAESMPALSAALTILHPGLPTDRAQLEAAFGPLRFVHLTRRDHVAQAVSLVRAQQTGLWHMAPDGTVLEQVGAPAPARYDAGLIAAALTRLDAGAAFWADWFARQAVVPIQVTHEELAADPAGTLGGIARALDLPLAASLPTAPATRRLSDTVSADWIARFRAQGGT